MGVSWSVLGRSWLQKLIFPHPLCEVLFFNGIQGRLMPRVELTYCPRRYHIHVLRTPHTAYNSMQHTTYHNMQHTIYNMQHTTYNIQPAACSMRHTAYSVRKLHFNSHTDNLGGAPPPQTPPHLGRKLQKRSKNLQALPQTSEDDVSSHTPWTSFRLLTRLSELGTSHPKPRGRRLTAV